MSAQGAVVGGQRHVQLPIGLLAMLIAALIAGSVGVVALELATGPRTVTTTLSTDWGSQFAHPRVVDRSDEATVTEMPVQRLYPDGFGAAAAEEMPVQRLYPDGFGAPADETTTIRIGVRRKW